MGGRKMIKETKIFNCTECNSEKIVKNGKTKAGKQQFHCNDCGKYGVLEPTKNGYSKERKEEIMKAYSERSSMRGIERIFGVSRHTLSKWLKKKQKICLH